MEYTIDPLSRFELEDILALIDQSKYFVLHAPRQTGKTSCLLALRDYLNAKGDYIAVYANVEGGQAARNNIQSTINTVCGTIADKLSLILANDQPQQIRCMLKDFDPNEKLTAFLRRLSMALPKPFVLFIDEIDSLVGDSLVSVLRQLRAGYDDRPAAFPQSVILCGVRDVRDNRIVLSNQDIITGGSAFNIKAESLRLGNFSKEEIHELYMQHTRETGQEFDEACFPMVWDATEGQPWLVNALGREVTWNMKENRDRTVRIIPEMIYRAQERIIYRRDTHIDILIDKLREDRVRRVIEAVLSKNFLPINISIDDMDYVLEHGIVKKECGKRIRIANGIYKKIINDEMATSPGTSASGTSPTNTMAVPS